MIGKLTLNLLAREPVMLGNVILAWIAVLDPSPLVLAATTITIGWIVRLLSSPKKAVTDARKQGYQKAVADISALHTK